MYFWQKTGFKIGIGAAIAVAVVSITLFSEQIGNLLSLFSSEAGTERSITWGDSSNYWGKNGSNFSGDACVINPNVAGGQLTLCLAGNEETGDEEPNRIISPYYFDDYEYLQKGLIVGKNFVEGVDYEVAVEVATDTFEVFAVAHKLESDEIPSFLKPEPSTPHSSSLLWLAAGEEVLEFSIPPYTQLPTSDSRQPLAISASGTGAYHFLYHGSLQLRQGIFLLPVSLHDEDAIKLSSQDALYHHSYPDGVPVGTQKYVYAQDKAYNLWQVELNPPPADLELPWTEAVFFNRDSGHSIPMVKKGSGTWPSVDPNMDPALNQLAMLGHNVGQLRVFWLVGNDTARVKAYDVSDNHDSDYTEAADLDEDEFFSVLPVTIRWPRTGDEQLKGSSTMTIGLGVSAEAFQLPATGKLVLYVDQIEESTGEPVAEFYIGELTLVCFHDPGFGSYCGSGDYYSWPVGYWYDNIELRELPNVFTSDWQIRGIVQGGFFYYIDRSVVDSISVIKSGVFKIVEGLT